MDSVRKFLDCKNAHTPNCPHVDEPVMKQIQADAANWDPDSTMDTQTDTNHKKAGALCAPCTSFEQA